MVLDSEIQYQSSISYNILRDHSNRPEKMSECKSSRTEKKGNLLSQCFYSLSVICLDL